MFGGVANDESRKIMKQTRGISGLKDRTGVTRSGGWVGSRDDVDADLSFNKPLACGLRGQRSVSYCVNFVCCSVAASDVICVRRQVWNGRRFLKTPEEPS